MRKNQQFFYVILVAIFALGVFYAWLPDEMLFKPFHIFSIEFSAGALGVYIAFWLEGMTESRNVETRKNRLLSDLKKELHYNTERMDGKGVLVKTSVWDSAISSGLVQSLSEEQLEELSKVYFSLEGYQYEAIRTRDASIRFGGLSPKDTNYHYAHDLWDSLSNNCRERERNTKEKIDELLETESFWK